MATEKSRLIRFNKLFEIAIMIVGAVGFYRRDLFRCSWDWG